jgi:hypothetical protein
MQQRQQQQGSNDDDLTQAFAAMRAALDTDNQRTQARQQREQQQRRYDVERNRYYPRLEDNPNRENRGDPYDGQLTGPLTRATQGWGVYRGLDENKENDWEGSNGRGDDMDVRSEDLHAEEEVIHLD